MIPHLEGMGLQGALLAHRLAMYGMPFTWHDIDAPHTAWKASTGAIYPEGGPERECYQVWKAWYENNYFDPKFLERARGMVFNTKKPPHKGKYEFHPLFHNVNISSEPSFHLNAQTFVPAMRERFASCRLPPELYHRRDPYIVTHGWGHRFHHAYWGWTRAVTLDYSALFLGEDTHRPSFQFRHPFGKSSLSNVMAYAYPIPGTMLYYAGSHILKQAKGKLHELLVTPKYVAWKQALEICSGGRVTVKHEGDFLTGWRPSGDEDEDTAWVRRKGNVITLRPLWHSGIRHFPKQWAGVAAQLGLIA